MTRRTLVLIGVSGVATIAAVVALLALRSGRTEFPSNPPPRPAVKAPVTGEIVFAPSGRQRKGREAGKKATSEARRPAVPPGYVTPKTHDPALAPLVDRRARAALPVDITSRIPVVKHPDDIPVVASILKDRGEAGTVRNEAANLLRRSGYAGLLDDLVGILDSPDEKPRSRAMAARHIWRCAEGPDAEGLDRAMAALRRALADPELPVRREALLALVRLGDDAGSDAAVSSLTDGDAREMRDLAIRCVADLGLREHIPAIRKCLQGEGEPVRIAAMVVLSGWGDEESRQAITEAASAGSPRLRRAAEAALKRLDGRVRSAEDSDKR